MCKLFPPSGGCFVIMFALLSLFLTLTPPQHYAHAANQTRRIFQGRDADIREKPYIVKLFIKVRRQMYVCAGSYVSEWWILTATHCIEDTNKRSTVRACMGDAHATPNYCGEMRHIKKIIAKRRQHGVDIAMLKVSKPFPVNNRTIAYGKLPNQSYPFFNEDAYTHDFCEIAGWGRTHKSPTAVEDLQIGRIKLTGSCTVGRTYWCALPAKELQQAACKGDSGSPVTCLDTIVGVLSVGDSSACMAQGTYYIKVHYFLDFILGVIDGTISATNRIEHNHLLIVLTTTIITFLIIFNIVIFL